MKFNEYVANIYYCFVYSMKQCLANSLDKDQGRMTMINPLGLSLNKASDIKWRYTFWVFFSTTTFLW